MIKPQQWEDTRIVLPSTLHNQRFTSLFSNDCHQAGTELEIRAALADFPVNLLYLSLSSASVLSAPLSLEI